MATARGHAIGAEELAMVTRVLQSGTLDAPAQAGVPGHGASRLPLTVPPTYGPGAFPTAERMVDQTLPVIDWSERHTDEHVEEVSRAVRAAVTA
ncbi:hypothetical protein [Micromonospora sp. NPDC048830]|uniref:hypothetical protein n=1 Tax=Micromonospora sp. NPDC048830 TaxID=3364257 RepID=UPI003715713A